MPRSTRVASAEPPLSSIPLRPSTNAFSTAVGSLSHAALKSSADICDVLAKASSESPPCATAVSILDIVLLMAVPADSAFWPVDAMDEAHARMSGVLMPMMEPMEPIRLAMSMICDSVDAPLFPRRTSESENAGMWLSSRSSRMFASCPRAVAASSALRSVATSMFETVVANVSSASVAIPSSPPIAWMDRICDADVTCVLEKSIADCLRFSKSCSVPLTVLRMSRYAESMSFAAAADALPRASMAGVSVADRDMPSDLTVDHPNSTVPPMLRMDDANSST